MPDNARIDSTLIRERLAGSRLPKDPTAVVLPPGSERWPPAMRAALTRALTPAGVLIPVIEHADGPTVLLTRRSAELRHHASQISFPGGRMEENDADVCATALRETEEEIGIPPEAIEIVGHLEPMPTVTGFAVTPSVGLLAPAMPLRVDAREVEEAFEVPLAFLLDRSNARAAEREVRGQRIPIVEFLYQDYRIWGATAHMLLALRKKLFKTNR